MGRTVLLRHDLPDGGHHFDWLLERAEGAPLLSFRVGARLDRSVPPVFEGQRTPDHRPAYLEYQGPVSGGRGSVSRLAEGWCRLVEQSDHALEAEVCFGGPAVRVRGQAGAGGEWVFRRLGPAPGSTQDRG